jgi:hypothetical protein
VQEILNSSRKHWVSARVEMTHFEVTGIARCACGEKLYSLSGKGNGGFDYYRCRGRQLKKGCTRTPIRRAALEQTVHEFIRTFFTRPEVLQQLLVKQLQPNPQVLDRQQKKLEEAHTAKKRLSNERRRLLTLTVQGLFPEEQVNAEARRIETQIQACDTTIKQLEEVRHPLADVRVVASAIASVFAECEFLKPAERKTLLRKFISSLHVDDSAITKAIVRLPAGIVKISSHTCMDTQFHNSIEVTIETDSPFRGSHPNRRKELGYRNTEILKLFAQGLTQSEIARKKGVSAGLVHALVRGKMRQKRKPPLASDFETRADNCSTAGDTTRQL